MSDSNSTVPHGFCQIPGYPRYCISENGAILSVCKRGKAGPWGDARKLVPTIDSRGYLAVSLCRVGHRPRKIKVHILALIAFVGPRPGGMECRHLDGNKMNNHVSNLAWGTTTENRHDRILHGTSSEGEKNGCAKLTADDVLKIRRRAKCGERQHVLANEFHVSSSAIWHIVRRRKWKHVP